MRKMVSFRLPPDKIKLMDRLAKQYNINRTELLVMAVDTLDYDTLAEKEWKKRGTNER